MNPVYLVNENPQLRGSDDTLGLGCDEVQEAQSSRPYVLPVVF